MDVLFKLSVVLCVGFIGGRVASLLKLPNVSGYLVFGLLLGPSITNFISATDSDNFTLVSELALALIAFSIGSEFIIKEMKKYGKRIMIITLTEVVGAIVLVFSVMYFGFKQDFAFSIVVASMSAATAPAATLLVMKQYRARGPLTQTILPVVALDDVYGIVAFGIAISLAVMSASNAAFSAWQMISKPMIEIGGSLVLGILLGIILILVVKLLKTNENNQVVVLTAIGLAVGISNLLGFSALLTNIVLGVIVVNFLPRPDRLFKAVNDFSSPIYVLFFTLAGASLDLKILVSVGWVGLAYILARGLGKAIGAAIGAVATKAEPVVVKYLGLALLPQGGISIGLTVIVKKLLPEYAPVITTIIMASVLIYEVSGPIFAKIAISKAKEIGGMDKIEDLNEIDIPEPKEIVTA
ncbi:MAG: cation:proton antiporter [Bacilli bacterium]|nr:cation:proton antiporter [Bacilli bacterium]